MGLFSDIGAGVSNILRGPSPRGPSPQRQAGRSLADTRKQTAPIADLKYGVKDQQLGAGVSDIFKRRMARLDGKSAAQSDMRENINRQADFARAQGMSAGQIHAMNRIGQRDLGRQMNAEERQNLGDAQSLLGNIIRGKTATEGAYGSLAAGQNVNTAPPPLNQGFLGLKVICTELHRQGLISDEVLEKEQRFGERMIEVLPMVYFGYRVLGTPVVHLMRRSKLATNTALALFWHFYRFIFCPGGYWKSAKNAPLGALISHLGSILCILAYFPLGMIAHWKFDKSQHLVSFSKHGNTAT